jgi:hypothetical protein
MFTEVKEENNIISWGTSLRNAAAFFSH